MAKQILTRIKDELKAMQQSRDQEYIQTEIKWNNKRSFSVECFRKGDSDEIRDADGNIIYDDLDSACVLKKSLQMQCQPVILPLDDCQYPPGRSPEHLTERE